MLADGEKGCDILKIFCLEFNIGFDFAYSVRIFVCPVNYIPVGCEV
jgi:hypothetical protein